MARPPTEGMFADLFAGEPIRRARRPNRFRWDWHLRNLLMACGPAAAAWLLVRLLERMYESDDMLEGVAGARRDVQQQKTLPTEEDVRDDLSAVRAELSALRLELGSVQAALSSGREDRGGGGVSGSGGEPTSPTPPTPATPRPTTGQQNHTVFEWSTTRAVRRALFRSGPGDTR